MKVRLHRPFPQQKLFMQSTARHTAFGGARGGGKSDAARNKAVLLAINYPGIQILFLRRQLTDLRENHLLPLMKILNGVAVYKSQEKEFLFPNGSRIVMSYCDAERDALKYQGQSYDVIFLEEATQFSLEQYDLIRLANRPSGLCKGFRPRMYYTCNPGGVGHSWVKRLFIDRKFTEKEKPENYAFIPSRVYDNPFIMKNDEDYVNELESLPEDLRKAFLDGNWDVFEGQYFREFDREIHVVKARQPEKGTTIYRTLDYGLDKLACYWVSVDSFGRAYVFREIWESDLIISEAAKRINEMSGEEVLLTYAPPDLWNRRQDTGKSVADIFAEHGIVLTKASNDRIAGWMEMHEWLTPKPDEFGGKSPRLTISESCPDLIRSIPALIHDKKVPGDVAGEPHEFTHGPDAIRYFIAGRPAKVEEQEYHDEGLEEFLGYGV